MLCVSGFCRKAKKIKVTVGKRREEGTNPHGSFNFLKAPKVYFPRGFEGGGEIEKNDLPTTDILLSVNYNVTHQY